MTKCEGCGKVLTDIKQLIEVSSLGLAMRGRCPDCSSWVWIDQLWQRTKYIDKTSPRANRKQGKKRSKASHISTPKEHKKALEGVLVSEVQNYAG